MNTAISHGPNDERLVVLIADLQNSYFEGHSKCADLRAGHKLLCAEFLQLYDRQLAYSKLRVSSGVLDTFQSRLEGEIMQRCGEQEFRNDHLRIGWLKGEYQEIAFILDQILGIA